MQAIKGPLVSDVAQNSSFKARNSVNFQRICRNLVFKTDLRSACLSVQRFVRLTFDIVQTLMCMATLALIRFKTSNDLKINLKDLHSTLPRPSYPVEIQIFPSLSSIQFHTKPSKNVPIMLYFYRHCAVQL